MPIFGGLVGMVVGILLLDSAVNELAPTAVKVLAGWMLVGVGGMGLNDGIIVALMFGNRPTG